MIPLSIEIGLVFVRTTNIRFAVLMRLDDLISILNGCLPAIISFEMEAFVKSDVETWSINSMVAYIMTKLLTTMVIFNEAILTVKFLFFLRRPCDLNHFNQ